MRPAARWHRCSRRWEHAHGRSKAGRAEVLAGDTTAHKLGAAIGAWEGAPEGPVGVTREQGCQGGGRGRNSGKRGALS